MIISKIISLFKRVYCEDCQHCLPDKDYSGIARQMEFAKCKMTKLRDNKHTTHRVERFSCCSVVRLFGLPFCFGFRAK